MPIAKVPEFEKAGTITFYDHAPPADSYPNYPSPAHHGG
jgi:hypothetical protein